MGPVAHRRRPARAPSRASTEARTACFLPVVRELAGAADAELRTRSLVVVLDGFWLELGTNPGAIERDQAVAMGMAWALMPVAGRD